MYYLSRAWFFGKEGEHDSCNVCWNFWHVACCVSPLGRLQWSPCQQGLKTDGFLSRAATAVSHDADDLPLSVRERTCPACGAIHDRDVAPASLNEAGSQFAVARRRWMCGAADRAGSRLDARCHLEQRQPCGSEDMIARHPAGVAREPSGMCFHGAIQTWRMEPLYCATMGSAVTSSMPSTSDCATRMRSKGSLCSVGSPSTVTACSLVMGNST